MSTMMASKRRPGSVRVEPGGPDHARRSRRATSRHRGSAVKRRADRDQPALVPLDHLAERLDHEQRAHARVLQHGLRGVAEPEPADHHVEAGPRQLRQREPGDLDLGHREQARHQEVVVELDLVDVLADDGSRRRRRLMAPIGVCRQSSSSKRALTGLLASTCPDGTFAPTSTVGVVSCSGARRTPLFAAAICPEGIMKALVYHGRVEELGRGA